jgi:starch phosphorylase
MKKLGPIFNTHRMVQEYFEKFYESSLNKRLVLSDKNWEQVKKLSEWKEYVKENWSSVKVEKLQTNKNGEEVFVGEDYNITADVNLGNLTPDDVEVQIYFGPVDKLNNPQTYSTVVMKPISEKGNPHYLFSGNIKSIKSGHQGYTIRIVPKHPLLINPFELGVVYWAE